MKIQRGVLNGSDKQHWKSKPVEFALQFHSNSFCFAASNDEINVVDYKSKNKLCEFTRNQQHSFAKRHHE